MPFVRKGHDVGPVNLIGKTLRYVTAVDGEELALLG